MSLERKRINAYWYGKKLSEETKNKLNLIALNRKKNILNQGLKSKCFRLFYTLTGIKTIYPSLRKACESIGTYLSTIKRIR